ncbi:MAG TPA: RluA family pseudouridine synthase [Thermodesulfovibrionia bacterium]|nr:RluA family pseudouridine synthase [Thermodesulfovibrionia bacterium]
METIKLIVHETDSERLDRYIALHTELSRSRVQELIDEGLVLVNGVKKKPKYLVAPADEIVLSVPEQKESQIAPEPLAVPVVWEDAHIVVVNKPAGMVVYPAPGHSEGTLLNALLYHCGALALAGGTERPGIVHRLDRDTSGLLVAAKSDLAYRSLTRQFQERGVKKHYRALAYGQFQEESGRFSKAIGRSRHDRKRMSTKTMSGKEAITDFLVLERLTNAMLVDVVIETGRTHQIRVHFAASGHPILGDPVYGKKTALRVGRQTITIDRQMLHAFSLAFIHPETGNPVTFNAPLPEDFLSLLDRLKVG